MGLDQFHPGSRDRDVTSLVVFPMFQLELVESSCHVTSANVSLFHSGLFNSRHETKVCDC